MGVLIINCTQHQSSPEQKDAGVIDLPEGYAERVREALTFNAIPTWKEMMSRARAVLDAVHEYVTLDLIGEPMLFHEFADSNSIKAALEAKGLPTSLAIMIGGAPFFMAALEEQAFAYGYVPLYAFSKRVVVEVRAEDGTVTKTAKFKHEGFIEAQNRYSCGLNANSNTPVIVKA